MTAMQRTFEIKLDSDHTAEDLFDSVSNDLKQSVAKWTGLNLNSEKLVAWPRLNLKSSLSQNRIIVEHWKSNQFPSHRLLSVGLVEKKGDVTHSRLIKLGADKEDQVFLWDSRDIQPAQAQFPVNYSTDLLDFLVNYECVDDDGLNSFPNYTLYRTGVQRFLDFLNGQHSSRQLPIVLVSTTRHGKQHLIDAQDLALRLQGMAHVIALKSGIEWSKTDLDLEHPCFNGAVRVYLPGYAQDDSARTHRWWHKDKFVPDTSVEYVDEIVRFVIEQATLRFRPNSIFHKLEREFSEDQRTSLTASRIAAIRETLKVEQEELFNDFYAEYQKVVNERDELQEQVNILEVESRSLRYRVNQQWQMDEVSEEEVSDGRRLLFSSSAKASLMQLDEHERDIFQSVILGKLLKDEMRSSQSEVQSTDSGPYFIYPRKKSAGGRRVIYILEAQDVKVCELFSNHDAYEQARDAGISLERYRDFEQFQVSV